MSNEIDNRGLIVTPEQLDDPAERWKKWTIMHGTTPHHENNREVEYVIKAWEWGGGYTTVGIDLVEELNWGELGSSTVAFYRDLPEVRLKADTEEYDMSAEELDKAIKAIKSDGGSSSYYTIPLPDAIIERIIETRSIETEDFIKYGLNNDFDLGNVVKCAVRIAGNQRGAGKEGASVEYDANKIQYSANKVKRYDKV